MENGSRFCEMRTAVCFYVAVMQRKMITVQQICALAALTVIKYRLKGTNMWADILL